MAEPNGNCDIPLTGDPRVGAALKRIHGKFQDLEDGSRSSSKRMGRASAPLVSRTFE